jgi:hypothetical protein
MLNKLTVAVWKTDLATNRFVALLQALRVDSRDAFAKEDTKNRPEDETVPI